ncbi:SusD-like starch-binding protein associating with outer membrane [Mucilaginibacter gracilis]|uniref:SusD-like starch-binding protein associating with outer membrane n=1 Tax=Mucilaginibacter gracilis TaxID=423350 RepID=A0A495IV19_9SPHI|nr:RagB/SusD family nutrient uptake outer membrane protein [Mucilaginibacter gracilis]RKR80422.1 SusD-like starch-binding protein associating with outer membrane [Mucilaginibacter gracilis]
MKKKHIQYLIIAVVIFISACKKDYLKQVPSTSVPAATSIQTPNDLTDAVNGLYVAARSSSLFGQNVPILGDLLADNVFVSSSNYGQLITESNYSFTSSSGEASGMWTQGYYTILQANRIINAGLPSSPTVDQLRGEAYTLRGLTYLTLVNYFATPATINPNALGVPIVTQPTYATGPYLKPARNTVAEVYARIITDLDSAYALMPTSAIAATYHNTSSNYIAKYAAKAIEARAYLYKGDYANARDAALLVVQNGGYTLATTPSAFAAYWSSNAGNSSKLETIFEFNNSVTSNSTAMAGLYYQSSNGEMLATTSLYNSYKSTDSRRALILNGIRKGNGQPAFVVNKYSNYLNADPDEIKVIRYAEVILTLAEGYARTTNEGQALIYLNQLAKLRDPAFAGYTSTGQQLLDDIENERRKELAFEGLRFFDLTRLNQVINRPAEPFSYPTYTPVLTTDIRRLQPIPQIEIQANPNIVPNPGYN